MQTGAGRLMMIDDVLATGGTLGASVVLAARAGYVVHGVAVLIDLGLVPGFRCGDFEPRTVLRYG
jgi:adenine phosphoribosyltransferase